MNGKMKIRDIEKQLESLELEAALSYLNTLAPEYGLSIKKLVEKYSRKKENFEKEVHRYKEMCRYETQAYSEGFNFIAGIDEAGRGPLAGPVVAAAVILPRGVFINGLNDSKQLSAKQRDELFDIINEKAVSIGVGMIDEKCIDEINILNATKKAMKAAVESLDPKPELLLTDAVKLEEIHTSQISIIKGDCLSVSIAAASIIAKVTRDRYIDRIDERYPQYGFKKHKGYGTREHIDAIKKYGICPIHRISFTKNFVG